MLNLPNLPQIFQKSQPCKNILFLLLLEMGSLGVCWFNYFFNERRLSGLQHCEKLCPSKRKVKRFLGFYVNMDFYTQGFFSYYSVKFPEQPNHMSTIDFCDRQWSRLLWVLALNPCLSAQGWGIVETQDLIFFHQHNPTCSRPKCYSACSLCWNIWFVWNGCTQTSDKYSTILGEQEQGSDLLCDPSVSTKRKLRKRLLKIQSEWWLKVCFISLSIGY